MVLLDNPYMMDVLTHSQLSTGIRLLSVKYTYNMLQKCFNEVVEQMKDMCPSNDCVTSNLTR